MCTEHAGIAISVKLNSLGWIKLYFYHAFSMYGRNQTQPEPLLLFSYLNMVIIVATVDILFPSSLVRSTWRLCLPRRTASWQDKNSPYFSEAADMVASLLDMLTSQIPYRGYPGHHTEATRSYTEATTDRNIRLHVHIESSMLKISFSICNCTIF